MKGSVSIGQNTVFRARRVLIEYRADNQSGSAYVSVHSVYGTPEGRARIGVGRPATIDLLSSLERSLGTQRRAEVLHPDVLWCGADHLVWWTPAGVRPMFFQTGGTHPALDKLCGRSFPQPALVWRVMNRSLTIRALATSERPTADTPLFVAPYLNTTAGGGAVCQGSMPSPDTSTAESIDQWVAAFYGSNFTHGNSIERGIGKPFKTVFSMWRSLAGKADFPSASLLPTRTTLEQFLRGGRE